MRHLTHLFDPKDIASRLLMSVDDDEMPTAPASSASGGGSAPFQKDFSGEIDADEYNKVPEMGEALPTGTYLFRLDSVKDGWSDEPKPGDKEFGYGRQPYFNVKWVAEEEPITGRAFFEFIPWISDEVAKAAASGDHTAQGIVSDRIWKLKTIASASGYKAAPGSKFNAKTFIATQPKVKIQLGQTEKKEKNTAGEWVGTGAQKNKANAYLSPFGQAARR